LERPNVRVVIMGASGLVGSATVEYLLKNHPEIDIAPVTRTLGNSWPLLCLGMAPVIANYAIPADVRQVVHPGDVVVNCALGSPREMVGGIGNLLRTCRERRVKRFIHLSSVTVYGSFPGPDCETEAGAAKPVPGTYGWRKLRQDQLVRRAHHEGLPGLALCIPHVTGPRSRSLGWFSTSLREGRFAFIDGGDSHCCLVDVSNVAHAIALAARSDFADGERCFINNDEDVSWHSLMRALSEIEELPLSSVPEVPAEEARARYEYRPSLRELASEVIRNSEVKSLVHSYLEHRPILGRGAGIIAAALRKASPNQPPAKHDLANGRKTSVPPDWGLIIQQMRRVRHSCEKARRTLGYLPLMNFAESMTSYQRYLSDYIGQPSEWWPMLKLLRGGSGS
jgi:nucleoside-diphosphate-sugar epimerase